MTSFFSYLLRRYDDQDRELQLKAGFILSITLVFIIFILPVLAYTAFLSGIFSPNTMVGTLALVFLLTALMVLVRGDYTAAAHIILTTGFAAPWIIIFQDTQQSLVTWLDTIVFIVGLLAVLPLFFFRTIKPVILYFLANILVFILFLMHLHGSGRLSRIEFVDYAMDNLVVMTLVFSFAVTLFYINQKVLATLTAELQERKKAEARLETFKILLANTLNSMPSVIVAVSRAIDVVLINKEAETVMGTTEAEARGQAFFNFFPQLRPYEETIRRVMQDQVVSQTYRITLDMGSRPSVFDMTVSPSDEGGAVIRLDDSSERTRMEEIMVQSEKMLSIGGLAAGMAHEINNPLGGMIQSTQVIRSRLSRSIPANEEAAEAAGVSMPAIKTFMEKREIFKLLDHIHGAGIRAAQIVENMLGFAREARPHKELHDMAGLIEDAVILAQSDYDLKKNHDFKKIELIRNFEADLPPVLCEKTKLQQVFFNLFKNAAQAMSGTNQTRPPKIFLDLKKQENAIAIKVRDNGPGMDEEIRKRIFEPFFTTKEQGVGTGLGMSVSYFIITEDHGGEMIVESAPGQGACFHILLPIE